MDYRPYVLVKDVRVSRASDNTYVHVNWNDAGELCTITSSDSGTRTMTAQEMEQLWLALNELFGKGE